MAPNSKGKALFILHAMILSLHLVQSGIIVYGLVRKCVKLSSYSQPIFILDLAVNYIDKINTCLFYLTFNSECYVLNNKIRKSFFVF